MDYFSFRLISMFFPTFRYIHQEMNAPVVKESKPLLIQVVKADKKRPRPAELASCGCCKKVYYDNPIAHCAYLADGKFACKQ